MTVAYVFSEIVKCIQVKDPLKVMIFEPRKRKNGGGEWCRIATLDQWTYFCYYPEIKKHHDAQHKYDNLQVKRWSIILTEGEPYMSIDLQERYTKPRTAQKPPQA